MVHVILCSDLVTRTCLIGPSRLQVMLHPFEPGGQVYESGIGGQELWPRTVAKLASTAETKAERRLPFTKWLMAEGGTDIAVRGDGHSNSPSAAALPTDICRAPPAILFNHQSYSDMALDRDTGRVGWYEPAPVRWS